MELLQKRANYAKISGILAKLKHSNPLYKDARVSESTLRLELDIVQTSTTYTFNVLENEGLKVFPEEIRLAIQDLFVIEEFALAFGMKDNIIDPNGGEFLLSSSNFNSLGAAIAYNELANGKLNLEVNNVVYMYNYDVLRFNKYGRSQYVDYALPLVNPPYSNNFISQQPSVDFSKDTLETCDPMITLSGAKKNSIVLSLNNPLLSPLLGQNMPFYYTDANLTVRQYTIQRIVLIMRGLLLQNCSNFQSFGS